MTPHAFNFALAAAQILTGMGILIFWLLFFTVGLAPSRPPPCYFEFEHAFPVADVLLGSGLIASGVNVIIGGRWGRPLSLACAGAVLFLGVIDVSFAMHSGIFAGAPADALQSGLISLWCVALGVAILLFHGCAATQDGRAAT